MQAARPDPVPEAWIEEITAVISDLLDAGAELRPVVEKEELAVAVNALITLPLSDAQREQVRPVLVSVATKSDMPTALALQAVRAASYGSQLPPDLVNRLLTIVQAATPDAASPLERSAAVDLLSVAELSAADQLQLASMLATLPAADIARLLPPLTAAGEAVLACSLATLAKHPRPDTLPREMVAAAVERAGDDAPAAAELLASIDAAVASQRQWYSDLVSSLPDGDAERGHRVFLSTKAACTSCHAMAYAGGRIGPDLTRIGGVRTKADLLEAILLPSASFVRSYEPVVVLTSDGKIVSGIAQEEEAGRLVVQTSANSAEVLSWEEIEDIRRGDVSLMPSGYDTLLSPQEIADLVAFLARAR